MKIADRIQANIDRAESNLRLVKSARWRLIRNAKLLRENERLIRDSAILLKIMGD